MNIEEKESLTLDELIELYVKQDKKELLDQDTTIKDRTYAFRHMLKYHTERERTWTLTEIMDCIKYGYRLVTTVRLGEFKAIRYSITNQDEFLQLVNNYGKNVKPRYLSYKEEIFMLIERFIIEWDRRFPSRVYAPKNSLNELHKYLFSKNRMTKADYEKLIKGVI